jgi:hypothetical protein
MWLLSSCNLNIPWGLFWVFFIFSYFFLFPSLTRDEFVCSWSEHGYEWLFGWLLVKFFITTMNPESPNMEILDQKHWSPGRRWTT